MRAQHVALDPITGMYVRVTPIPGMWIENQRVWQVEVASDPRGYWGDAGEVAGDRETAVRRALMRVRSYMTTPGGAR